MSKWISAELIKALMKNDRLMQGNCEYELWKQEVDKRVDRLPSIELITCEECNYMETFGATKTYYWCDQWEHYTDKDSFCREAKPRAEQTDWNCAVCEYFRSDTEEAAEKCIYCNDGSNFQEQTEPKDDECKGCIYDGDKNIMACVSCKGKTEPKGEE